MGFLFLSQSETGGRHPKINEVYIHLKLLEQGLNSLSGTLLRPDAIQLKTEHKFMDYQLAERRNKRPVDNDRIFPLESVGLQSFRSKHDDKIEHAIVHSGPYADELARSLNALAITIGSDIYFRNNAYNSSEEEGRKILAHELTHIAQYEGKRIGPNSTRKELEEEAVLAEEKETSDIDPMITLNINEHRYRFAKSKMNYYADIAAENIERWIAHQKFVLSEREYLGLLCAFEDWLGGR